MPFRAGRSFIAVLVVLSSLLVMNAAAISVAARSPGALKCAGPGRLLAGMVAHPSRYGAHARQLLYDRARLGCVPVGDSAGALLRVAFRDRLSLASRPPASKDAVQSVTAPWQLIGPRPVGSGSRANSGRNLVLTWDAALNGGTLFAGTADGGIWSATTPFTNWKTHTDSLPSLAIGALAVDPTDVTGKTLYAGTGEQASAYDSLYGHGLYKTIDGGLTWTAIGPAGMAFGAVSRIVVDSLGNLYVGLNSYNGGVWMSTDHGVTWSNTSNLKSDGISDLAIDAVGDVYAAVGLPAATQTHGGVWECLAPCTTTNSFKAIAGGASGVGGFPTNGKVTNIKLAIAPLTGAPSNEAVYVVAGDSSNGTKVLGVWRATGAGAGFETTAPTWTRIATKAVTASYESQVWYDLAIWADPADTAGDTVYLALTDLYKTTSAMAVTPSWINLTRVYGSGGTGVHPDQHAITSNGAGVVFFGNDGGVWDSTNGGSTFTDLNGNLSTLQFYSGDLGATRAEGCQSRCDPTARIGGLQDNGTAQTSGGRLVWSPDSGFGDGGFALIDPKDNGIRYGENANGGVAVSTNGGRNFHDASPANCGSSNFMAPLALDPKFPTTVFAGMRNLCQTTNATAGHPSWKNISNRVTRSPVSAVTMTRAGGKPVVYMADSSGHTYYSANFGSRWISMDGGSCPGPLCSVKKAQFAGPGPSWNFASEVTALAADPKHKGVVYAVLNGFQGKSAGHVFKWTNSSLSGQGRWTDISGSLPDEPYDTIAVNPTNSSILYLGGITGAFITSSGPAGWRVMGSGLPNVQVDDLRVSADGKTVVAFTHGRSAWSINASTAEARG